MLALEHPDPLELDVLRIEIGEEAASLPDATLARTLFAPRTGSLQGRLQARDAAAELGEGVLRLDAELLEEA